MIIEFVILLVAWTEISFIVEYVFRAIVDQVLVGWL